MAIDLVSEVADLASQRQADGVNDSLNSLNGIVLEDVDVNPGGTTLWHHLGVNWTQYEVLKQSANATIFSPGGESDRTKEILLDTNNKVTITVRVR